MTTKRINKLLYFAYGSNLCARRLRQPDRVPSAHAVGIGYIAGYRLTFYKRSTRDGSGKCDVERTADPDDRVHGVLYEIDSAEKPRLDAAEGGYAQTAVQVVTTSGLKAALTYCAQLKDPSLKPYHWYKAFVVAGAVEHGLPASYIEWLKTTESVQDQDAARRRKNERLLRHSP